MSSFSFNLAQLLEKNNLTISQLAEEINVTISTLSKLINGKVEDPRATTLKQLAQYFNISIDELLGIIPFQNTKELQKNIPILSIEQLSQPDKVNNVMSYKNIHLVGLNPQECFISYIDSPAMYPLFDKNTLIVFHKTSHIQHGQYVLCRLFQSNEILLRQISIDGTCRILQPLNNDFQNVKLEEKDQIIAVAIQIYRELT